MSAVTGGTVKEPAEGNDGGDLPGPVERRDATCGRSDPSEHDERDERDDPDGQVDEEDPAPAELGQYAAQVGADVAKKGPVIGALTVPPTPGWSRLA